MSNQADHTIVRLRVPPELKKQIEESSEKNNRSQSAEMVARLEESFLPSLDKANMHMALSGFCAGLHFRYQDQLKSLQDELNKESSANRIKALNAEIYRVEILSEEMKTLSSNLAIKGD